MILEQIDTKTIQNVIFKLKYDPAFNGVYYIILQEQEQKPNPKIIKEFQMQLDNESKYYYKEIEVYPQIRYKYCYSRRNYDKNAQENQCRGFFYNQQDLLEVDEWNKQWYKYILNVPIHEPQIFYGYQAFIRDLDNQNEIKLDIQPNNSMSAKEIMTIDKIIKNRQLCFYQQNFDGQRQKVCENSKIFYITQAKKFQISSNLLIITVDFQEINNNARLRMESYSELYNEAKKSKQQLNEAMQSKEALEKINMEIQKQHEQQKTMMEQEFNDFKSQAEKSIKKYIDQNNQDNQKIMELNGQINTLQKNNQEEQEKNRQYRQEFQSKISCLEYEQHSTVECEWEWETESDLNTKVDIEEKQQFKKTITEMFNKINFQNQGFFSNIRVIIQLIYFIVFQITRKITYRKNSISEQQFQLIIEEISKILQLSQEGRNQKLKSLGVQTISELKQQYPNSEDSLINEDKYLQQICKLIVITNLISKNQQNVNSDSQQISYIKNLVQHNNQLQNYFEIRKDYIVSQTLKNTYKWIITLLMYIFLVLIFVFLNQAGKIKIQNF